MNKTAIIFSTLAFFVHFASFCSAPEQRTDPLWVKASRVEYGMNIGFYYANASTANYYNGSGDNNLWEAINRIYNYNNIRRDIGYDFTIHGLPMKMSYNPAIMMGFYGILRMVPSFGIIAEFNYARLRAEDNFTLLIDRASFIEGDNIELFRIWGLEERVDLRIGFQHIIFSRNSYVHPFFETGISLTDTKVKEHRARIHSSLINLRKPKDVIYDIRDYGIGMGGFFTTGLRMDVNEDYALVLGYSLNKLKINLGDNNKFTLQHTAFLRLNLDGLGNGQ
jgi:hypothetical protein